MDEEIAIRIKGLIPSWSLKGWQGDKKNISRCDIFPWQDDLR